MKFWWLINTQRVAAEREAVAALVQNESWFELQRWCFHAGRFSAEGILAAHGHRYPVRLVYPDQYPEVPAWVEPQGDIRWTTHQYGEGALCLELRPDNWISGATGVDVLRSAHNLLIHENPLGEGKERAPSAHHVGELQAYDWGASPVLVGASCLARLRHGTAVGLSALRWMANNDVWPILIHDEVDRCSSRRPPGHDLDSWRFEIPAYLSERSPPVTSSPSRTDIAQASGLDPEAVAALETSTAAVLIFKSSELEVFHLVADGGTYRRRVFVVPDEDGVRSGRPAAIAGKRVTVVGAGSVGSKIAEVILRSGVHRLTLVDGDVLLPGNLERHVLDWRDVGFRKVHGLKRRLLAIAPGADVRAIDVNLNWQRSAKTHAWQVEEIAEGDVIVDGTGDPATALFLAAIAEANDRPFVSAEVFEGGLGALVATCVPKRDPPFVEGRATFLAWCDAQGVKAPEPGSRQYEMLAEDGSPVTADDAAVTMTAAHAARVILDTLDGNPPPTDSAWLLLGYRKDWLFDGHGHTIRLDVGERGERSPMPENAEVQSFVLTLFKEWVSESSAGT